MKALIEHDGYGYSITHPIENHFVGSGASEVNLLSAQTPPWHSSAAFQPQWTYNGFNHDSYSLSYNL